MPLVVVCGRPLGGKTVRSYALAAHLRTLGHEVVVVSDSALRTNARSIDEAHRHELRAAVERTLASPTAVCICDAANEVRGFRYELHCLAKARATPICTLYCDVADAVTDARNVSVPPVQKIDAESLVFLRRRFETPSAANKWERPLFICADSDVSIDAKHHALVTSYAGALSSARAASPADPNAADAVPCPPEVYEALGLPLDDIRAALFDAVAPTPNFATTEVAVSTAASVHSLDAATGAVVAAVLRAVNDVAFIPGDEVSLEPATGRRVVVGRKVGAAELGRLRRQFVRVNEAAAATLANPADAFADFLKTALA